VIAGRLVTISGQLPIGPDGPGFIGKLAKAFRWRWAGAARLCALNLLAQLKSACGGDLDQVRRCVRLGVFVNSEPSFTRTRKSPMALPT